MGITKNLNKRKIVMSLSQMSFNYLSFYSKNKVNCWIPWQSHMPDMFSILDAIFLSPLSLFLFYPVEAKTLL